MKKKHRKKIKKFSLLLFLVIVGIACFLFINKKTDVFAFNHSSTDDLSIYLKLEEMSEDYPEIKTILERYYDYPEKLLHNLSINIEMLDYVLDFLNQKGKVSKQGVDKFSIDEVPLLLQWDKRWGYGFYGDDYMAITGCGPTTLAMVILYLTGDISVTPYTVATYAAKNGYYVKGSGTSWELMTKGGKYFGVEGKEIPLSRTTVYSYLETGHPIICSMRPGDFTTQGHFIVLAGIEKGKIKVNDPNSEERSSILWDYERLEKQIRNLWTFSKN